MSSAVSSATVETTGHAPWRLTLGRFVRDRWSLAAAIVFALILVVSIAGGPVAQAFLHHNGEDLFPYAVNWNQKPVGPLTHIYASHSPFIDNYGDLVTPPKGQRAKTLLAFGGDGPLGRDELIRVLDGGRASLEVAIGGMLIALLIGLPLGAVAGYFGGLWDTIVARLTETIMAFPLMLFLVWASVRLDQYLTPVALGSVFPRGIFAEALLIGVFTSFYPTRLIRAQLLPLRNTEFVEASRMVGASDWRILRRHLLPHLLSTLLVWGAIAVATNVLLEVGLSFLGAGVQPQTPTWGSLLSTTWGTVFNPRTFNSQNFTAWQTIFPAVAVMLAVVSLNQLSEGIRRALEPWSAR